MLNDWDQLNEIEKQIKETERKLKELKDIKEKLIGVDDLRKIFFDTFDEFIEALYDEYRLISISELISVPYDEKSHMSRWFIYDTHNPDKLNFKVHQKARKIWEKMYKDAVRKETKNRVVSVKNKKGDIQVSKQELEKIRENLTKKIYNIFEEI